MGRHWRRRHWRRCHWRRRLSGNCTFNIESICIWESGTPISVTKIAFDRVKVTIHQDNDSDVAPQRQEGWWHNLWSCLVVALWSGGVTSSYKHELLYRESQGLGSTRLTEFILWRVYMDWQSSAYAYWRASMHIDRYREFYIRETSKLGKTGTKYMRWGTAWQTSPTGNSVLCCSSIFNIWWRL